MINWILGIAIIAYSSWMGYRFFNKSIKGGCSCGHGDQSSCCESNTKGTF